MLLSPFTLTETPNRRPSSGTSRVVAVPPWLLAWAAIGGMAVLCVPALRGGPETGMTLPFWLFAAPMLNILWLTRNQWQAVIGRMPRPGSSR